MEMALCEGLRTVQSVVDSLREDDEDRVSTTKAGARRAQTDPHGQAAAKCPRLLSPLGDTVVMIEVRRDEDYELCGFVAEAGDHWLAMTVFGAELGHRDDYGGAVQLVLDEGLASLADHWMLSGPDVDGEQIVCIQHASRGSVTLALDYYSMPGVPSLTLSTDQLHSGLWTLIRSA
ncbi:MAG: hypothetical protein R2761_29725 [Acidimicrobiales bacterium]